MAQIPIFNTIFTNNILDDVTYLDEFKTYVSTTSAPAWCIFVENTIAAIESAKTGNKMPLNRMVTILNEYKSIDGFERARGMGQRLVINSQIDMPHLDNNSIGLAYYIGSADPFITSHEELQEYATTFQKWQICKNSNLERDCEAVGIDFPVLSAFLKDFQVYDYLLYTEGLKDQILQWAFNSRSLQLFIEHSNKNNSYSLKDFYSKITPALIKYVSEHQEDSYLLVKAYIAYANAHGFEIRPPIYGAATSKTQLASIVEKQSVLTGFLALTDITNPKQSFEILDMLKQQKLENTYELPTFEL